MVKYALGRNPATRADASQFPTSTLVAGSGEQYLTLTVPRRNKRTDVQYIGEVSSDLAGWNSGAGHTVIVTDTETALVVRDAQPLIGSASRYMRLKIREP